MNILIEQINKQSDIAKISGEREYVFKIGFDGAKSMYNIKFNNDDTNDSQIFIVGIVPLMARTRQQTF